MFKIDEDSIFLYFDNQLILLKISTWHFIRLYTDFFYLCPIYNYSNVFLASFSKRFIYYGLYVVSCDVNIIKIYSQKFSENLHNNNIIYIYQLSNGEIITCSKEKDAKIWA